MKYYTLDDIMELEPCHNRNKLETYMKGRKRISLSGILSSKASDDDKVWLVTRLLHVDAAAEFAKWCADSVSHLDNDWVEVAHAAARAAAGADNAARAACAAHAAAYAARAARAAAGADNAAAGADNAARGAAYAARAARAAAGADNAAAGADNAARGADRAYGEARKNQIAQLKLIVKEHNL